MYYAVHGGRRRHEEHAGRQLLYYRNSSLREHIEYLIIIGDVFLCR